VLQVYQPPAVVRWIRHSLQFCCEDWRRMSRISYFACDHWLGRS